MSIITVKSEVTQNSYKFVDVVAASGGMKEVYFSPDKKYVVAFYKKDKKVTETDKRRLQQIATQFRAGIFKPEVEEYWSNRFCWPIDVVQHEGRIGVVVPTYGTEFFFEHGSVNGDQLGIKGKEKEAKWFTSPKNRAYLDPKERGTWADYLRVSLNLARAVRRMHMQGLAHSDLSYRNVLINPVKGSAAIIDIDGLVVKGIFPPEVAGTPDFIAPEVLMTQALPLGDPKKITPSDLTDRHALAVLIYLYLFARHPLDGGARHDDDDPTRDTLLKMGEKALFVEHPTDSSNRVNLNWLDPKNKFWGNPDELPYTIAGPYLKPLFERAFIDGLHDPAKRPVAIDWEKALIKTMDLLQPCTNPQCEMKWYAFANTSKPKCPFCGSSYSKVLPMLDAYRKFDGKNYRLEEYRIMVWDGLSFYPHHFDALISPNERITRDQLSRVAYFVRENETWFLHNMKMPSLQIQLENEAVRSVAINERVELVEGMKILTGVEDNHRLFTVKLINPS